MDPGRGLAPLRYDPRVRYGMIMAGGSGTRLWPLSRRAEPKQLLRFIGGKSLLEIAGGRLEGVIPAEQRLVCAAEAYRERILRELPWLRPQRYLGEPQGRDTLNAVGFAAAVLATEDAQATFAVLTADHLIEPQEEFARAIELGFRLVESQPSCLVTFGVAPTFAATGYGYVERGEPLPGFDGAFRAMRFVEKPDRPRAEEYLASGSFLWNSGMFVFRATTILEAIERFKPECAKGLHEIASAWGGPAATPTIARIYPTLPKTSIDYGVMEPASRDPSSSMAVVPMGVRWMDVGSWPAFAETLAADADGHRTSGVQALHLDSRRVLVVGDDPQHLVATIGCEDLIVVRTKDATLICRSADAERVKDLAGRVPPGLQ